VRDTEGIFGSTALDGCPEVREPTERSREHRHGRRVPSQRHAASTGEEVPVTVPTTDYRGDSR
jgi:hypothetical protein